MTRDYETINLNCGGDKETVYVDGIILNDVAEFRFIHTLVGPRISAVIAPSGGVSGYEVDFVQRHRPQSRFTWMGKDELSMTKKELADAVIETQLKLERVERETMALGLGNVKLNKEIK